MPSPTTKARSETFVRIIAIVAIIAVTVILFFIFVYRNGNEQINTRAAGSNAGEVTLPKEQSEVLVNGKTKHKIGAVTSIGESLRSVPGAPTEVEPVSGPVHTPGADGSWSNPHFNRQGWDTWIMPVSPVHIKLGENILTDSSGKPKEYMYADIYNDERLYPAFDIPMYFRSATTEPTTVSVTFKPASNQWKR